MFNLTEMTNMSGRTSVITGGTGHIASFFADCLAGLDSNLVLIDQDLIKLNNLKNQLENTYKIRVEVYEVNLEHEDQRNRVIKDICKNHETLDVLINAAALVATSELQGWTSDWRSQTLESWKRGLEVNLTSVFHLTNGLTALFMKSEHASIINIGSLYGFLGPQWDIYEGTSMGNSASYSASKGGVLQFSRWLATTLSPVVRVNSISPGGIFRDQDPKFVSKFLERTPLGRMGTEEDLVGACIYLATDLSKYVTGQNLIVDGGWSAW
jgi:NAD(P)-dependent dehydrogenase (short-subunit alcohol dehydrogenase family)